MTVQDPEETTATDAENDIRVKPEDSVDADVDVDEQPFNVNESDAAGEEE